MVSSATMSACWSESSTGIDYILKRDVKSPALDTRRPGLRSSVRDAAVGYMKFIPRTLRGVKLFGDFVLDFDAFAVQPEMRKRAIVERRRE